MFNLFKNKNIVEFYTPFEEFLAVDKYQPYLCKRDMSQIMKDIPPITFGSGNSITNCPGIIQYLKTGYIIPAWQDFAITTNGDGKTFQWKNANNIKLEPVSYFPNAKISEVLWHPSNAFFKYFPRENTLEPVIKFDSPWFIKLPPGYSALFLPVFYDNEERFSSIPGILQTDYYNPINIQVYWNRLNSTEIIKAGTPLVKIIPIKNENWKHVIRLATKEDALRENTMNFFSKTVFDRSMKKIQKIMDNYKN
jgi:hypothetical protein